MTAILRVIKADITILRVDAIVNSANSFLLGGDGVNGVIHEVAGSELLDECRLLGGCKVGDAKITKGYRLPAKFVIHTVGPIWQGGDKGEPELLASCYRRSIEVAVQSGVRSIAFPCISSGKFGYPIEFSSQIAYDTVVSTLESYPTIDEVSFCCFSVEDYKTYEEVVMRHSFWERFGDETDPDAHKSMTPKAIQENAVEKARSDRAREFIIDSIDDSTEINTLVRQYLQEHPDYIFPTSGDMHPSILALSDSAWEWLKEKMGGIYPYEEALLRSAEIWFSDGKYTVERRLFDYRFSSGLLVSDGGDDPRFIRLCELYNEWRKKYRWGRVTNDNADEK